MKVRLPKEYDMEKIQIGIQVAGDKAEKEGLFKVGDIVLPSGKFDPQSRSSSLRNRIGADRK